MKKVRDEEERCMRYRVDYGPGCDCDGGDKCLSRDIVVVIGMPMKNDVIIQYSIPLSTGNSFILATET